MSGIMGINKQSKRNQQREFNLEKELSACFSKILGYCDDLNTVLRQCMYRVQVHRLGSLMNFGK